VTNVILPNVMAPLIWHCVNQRNDIELNDSQHNGLKCDNVFIVSLCKTECRDAA
jgi:hypothetical protein